MRQNCADVSGAAASVLKGADPLQLVKVMTARGQFGNSFLKLSLADLFICFGAYQLPQLAAAEFPGVEFFCVHGVTTWLLLRRVQAAVRRYERFRKSVLPEYDNRVMARFSRSDDELTLLKVEK